MRISGWDYSNSNMDAESSIHGGMGWMLHYRAKCNTRIAEEEEIRVYEIKKGDSFAKIAKELGTTTQTLIKYNPNARPEGLQIGQKVNYVQASEERYISGWGAIVAAVKRYNSNPKVDYLGEVSKAKKDLDRLDELRTKHGLNK